MTAVEDETVLALGRPIPSQEWALTSTTASGDELAQRSRGEAGWVQDVLPLELPADAEGARASRDAEEPSYSTETRGRCEQLTLPLDRAVAPSTASGGCLP